MAHRIQRPWREGDVLEVALATPEDVKELGPLLSAQDCAELRATQGLGPTEALLSSYARSDEAYFARAAGRPVAVWGYAVVPEAPAAAVWMFANEPELQRAPLAFTRVVREQLGAISARVGVLYGYADERNPRHLKWLQSLGFRFLRAVPDMGAERRTFYEFIGSF